MRRIRFLALCALITVARSALAAEAPASLILHPTPKTLSEIAFEDDEGRKRGLSDLKGKVVLLNVWATWCTSCREEMPTLDRLQARLGGPDFEVVALSIDRAGPEVVRAFFSETGVEHLALYIDQSGKANRKLDIIGLPTTLLIDRDELEVGRLIGPAEWDAAGTVAFIQSRILSNATTE